MSRRAIALLTALMLALLLASPAAAHATLVRSDPAAGATLETSPPSMRLEFSEPLDPSFSRAQLADAQGKIVEPGPGEVQTDDPRVLKLILPDLPRGSYTAIWRVRSAADGHITEGSIPFGVGVPVAASSLIPPLGTPDPATLPPPPLDTLARWLNLAAAATALGGLPFALLVWRPAYRRMTADDRPTTSEGQPPATVVRQEGLEAGGRADSREETLLVSPPPGSDQNQQSPAGGRWPAIDDRMTAFLRRQLFYGGAALVATSLFFLLLQAAAAADVPISQAIGAPLLELLNGRSGLLGLARVALVVQLMVLAWRMPAAGGGPARLWWIALAIGGVALLTLSLTSHAAAELAAPMAVPADWLHIAAAVAWLGGLIPFVYAARAARAGATGEPDSNSAVPLSVLVPRFSWLAAPCVAILTLTGIYQYLLHVERLDLLAATTYGRALLVKLGLFAILLGLGGLNLFVLSRRLRGSGNRLARAFAGSARAELVVGALVLLAAGVMTSVAPSLTAWAQHERQGIAQTAAESGVTLTLRIAPAQIGDNEFAVDVRDPRPGASAAPTKVLLRFDMLGHDMGKLQEETQPAGDERYTARGSFTTMGGRWHVEVVLRRAGFDDVRHTFEVDITQAPDDS